jgi:alanyl-tRNA synthetase
MSPCKAPHAADVPHAGQKKGGANGLKFEAEATAYLQSNGVPLTDDKPKYGQANVATPVRAILSRSGFVQSTAVSGLLRWVGDCVGAWWI